MHVYICVYMAEVRLMIRLPEGLAPWSTWEQLCRGNLVPNHHQTIAHA